MAQYEARIGHPDCTGRVLFAFRPPINLTQNMVDQCIGAGIHRVTVGEQRASVPEASAHVLIVAEASEDLGLTSVLKTLGQRICHLAAAQDVSTELGNGTVENYSQRPLAHLITRTAYDSRDFMDQLREPGPPED